MPNNTSPTVLDEFKNYAYFSVRVDRYFNVVNIYGMHHNAIKQIYGALPSRHRLKAVLALEADEDVKRFLDIAANALGDMATTNILAFGHLTYVARYARLIGIAGVGHVQAYFDPRVHADVS
jgi:hypothetical protein